MVRLLIVVLSLAAQQPRCSAAGDTASVALADVERRPVADSANATPKYPDLLRQAAIGGPVRVTFTVDTAGRVEAATIRIVRSPNPGFDLLVKRAVATWRYAPATRCGHPVRVRLAHEFAFQASPMPRDTLRWAQLFEIETGVAANSDTLPDGTPRTTVSSRQTLIEVVPARWGTAALDSAEEAALVQLIGGIGPATSGLARVVCVPGTQGWASDPDSGRLVRLERPGLAVLPIRRCPPTFASMIQTPGERPAPPGEDPYMIRVVKRSPISATRLVIDADVAHGTGGAHYRCGVERRDGGWRARCIGISSWAS